MKEFVVGNMSDARKLLLNRDAKNAEWEVYELPYEFEPCVCFPDICVMASANYQR